ncbi:hypothetical protein RB653_008126 [Dictyostelium firmibasis]|uniref:Dickkopf N-terminal cysteine-rich domain-containing protein n=1 Tax=Dictyostelium firmibasis TaxID=79012 RepID=A0AAN7TZV6_9MYCE
MTVSKEEWYSSEQYKITDESYNNYVVSQISGFAVGYKSFTCTNASEKCDYNTSICPQGYDCQLDIIGNTVKDYKCVTIGNINDKCNGDEYCDHGLMCENSTKTCQNIKFASLGEECSKESDCSDILTCENGICINKNNNCKDYFGCTLRQFCKNGKCFELKKPGEQCEYNMDLEECEPFYTCQSFNITNGSIGKCVSVILNMSLGQPCEHLYECDFVKNQVCLNKTCVQYVPNNQTTSCIGNPDICDDFSICSLDDGKCYLNLMPNKYLHYANFYQNCLFKYNCSIVENSRSPNSCFSKYCSKEICEYHSIYSRIFGICNAKTYCRYKESNNEHSYSSQIPSSSIKINSSLMLLFSSLFIILSL